MLRANHMKGKSKEESSASSFAWEMLLFTADKLSINGDDDNEDDENDGEEGDEEEADEEEDVALNVGRKETSECP